MRKNFILILSLTLFLFIAIMVRGLNIFAKSGPPKFVVYYALDDEEGKSLISKFEKLNKIKVRGERRSSGHLIKLIYAQRKKPVASVVFGGPITSYIQGKKLNLFQPYHSPQSKSYPAKFKDKDGYWYGIYVGVIGFATNTKSKVKPPTSWYELLKPEYRGGICIANPAASGTAYTVLATLVQLMGKEKAFKYMKRLHKQIKTYTKSGSQPAKLVGLGVGKVGISFAHDILREKRKGYPLVLTFPKEGTGWEIGGVALIKNAPQKEWGKKFIDFLLSEKAQNLYGKGAIAPRFPTNPQVKPPAGAVPLSKIKIIEFDFVWAGKNQESLSSEWNQRVFLGK